MSYEAIGLLGCGNQGVCSVDGCTRKRKAKGKMCSACYERRRRTGSVEGRVQVDRGYGPARLAWLLAQAPTDECLDDWGDYLTRTPGGYVQLRVDGKLVLATHLACPGEGHVLHSCDNPACVNPAHLRRGTNAENVADKVSRNRQTKGVDVHCAVLTDEAVGRILVDVGVGRTFRGLAAEHGVSEATISDIAYGVAWKHVAGPRLGRRRKPRRAS